jgi:mono/diheme cytochrome c family protein
MWQSSREKYAYLKPAVQPLLFWGMLSAVVSCITGFLLSQGDEYDHDLVGWHQWLGIGVTVVSLGLYLFRKKVTIARWQRLAALLLLLLVMITGHFGGSLTHGSDYLTASFKGLSNDSSDLSIQKPLPNVQEAFVYTDIVQPLFKSKCYSCHGPAKQKGRLRMDQPELLMKGGKNGEVLIAGNAAESELIKRLLLPLEDEHHMPPKEKPQLNDEQVALLHWWITQGADFNKKVKELDQPEKLKPALLALEKGAEVKKVPEIPMEPVEKAEEPAINKLRNRGVIILPVGVNSNYLLANFVNTDSVSKQDIELLLPIKKQLVWLKLGSTNLGDSSMAVIAQCTNLTRLQLDHTKITDLGLEPLKSLTRLQTLNLVGTKVTAEGVKVLKDLEQLQSIYLYQTNVNRQGFIDLQNAFPQVQIDSGGYSLPFLETDTMIATPVMKP